MYSVKSCDSMVDIIQVGEKNPISNIHEGMSISYHPSTSFLLNLSIPKIQQHEKESFRFGNIEIRLVDVNGCIVLCFDTFYGDDLVLQYDILFNINLCGLESIDELPHIEEGEGLFVSAVLTEHDTNIVEALRAFSMTTSFSQALLKSLKRQFDKDFNEEEYTHKAEKILDKYSSDELRKLSIARMKLR